MSNILQERKVVQYKGQEFILNPGHSVYELNFHTGEVIEKELVQKPLNFFSTLLGFKSKVYTVENNPNSGTLCLPAASIYKAKIKFKKAFGNKIKIKGL